MLKIFKIIADIITYRWLELDSGSKLGKSINFFIEDTTKILILLLFMVYIIAILRASLNVERVRDFLKGKNRFIGYVFGALFGAITPFCSCSSIPLFFGFTQAAIPVGITMSFLITSPMINEVAIVLLGGILGYKFTIIYVAIGLISGIVGGIFFDLIKAERYFTDFAKNITNNTCNKNSGFQKNIRLKLTLKDRHNFAKSELKQIFGKVWKWVIIGVGLGAALHGYVPDNLIMENLGEGQWWSVPISVLIGIPLYSNATGIIPVVKSLLSKGLPLGTTLAFMMSTVAASFPEFMLLKQVMKIRLLVILFILLLILFTITGWTFNFLENYIF
jgi:uncharacterized membrane protein YraQ (UPF0718 family)